MSFKPVELSMAASVLFVFSIACSNPACAAPNTDQPELKRYLVFTDATAAKAAANGARLVQQTRGLKAVVCPQSVAQTLGLIEDIPVQAADSAANALVMAAPVQRLGLTGHGRKIVVLDTGYNYNHPELRSSYLGGKDFVNHDDDPFDDNGHGSHVAGIITGDGIDPRARGIAPETGIIVGKVLDSSGNGYISDIVAGIYWAVDGPDGIFGTDDDFHADAINISIGTKGSYVFLSTFCDAAVPSMTDAIKYAIDHGVPVVVAAGNNGISGVSLPGCVSYAMTVGAIDQHSLLASFSGTGPSVDLVAPGVGLYSASLGASYKSMEGTSQAAPVVSGAIALFKEAFPDASVDDIQSALLPTAVDLGWLGKDNLYGWGRMDAYQALGGLTGSLANIALSLSQSNGQTVISWPASPPGFVLQSGARLDSPPEDWLTITNPVVTIGSLSTTALGKPLAGRFYRLRWQ